MARSCRVVTWFDAVPRQQWRSYEFKKHCWTHCRIRCSFYTRVDDHVLVLVRNNCHGVLSRFFFIKHKLFKKPLMSMAEGQGGVVDNMSARIPSHVCLPLNSSHVTAGQLWRLSTYGVGFNVVRLNR